jgi:hypothetical protein
VKAGQEPAAPECGVGVLDGGDTGESNTGNGHCSEYMPFGVLESGWCGAAGGWRWTPC